MNWIQCIAWCIFKCVRKLKWWYYFLLSHFTFIPWQKNIFKSVRIQCSMCFKTMHIVHKEIKSKINNRRTVKEDRLSNKIIKCDIYFPFSFGGKRSSFNRHFYSLINSDLCIWGVTCKVWTLFVWYPNPCVRLPIRFGIYAKLALIWIRSAFLWVRGI